MFCMNWSETEGLNCKILILQNMNYSCHFSSDVSKVLKSFGIVFEHDLESRWKEKLKI